MLSSTTAFFDDDYQDFIPLTDGNHRIFLLFSWLILYISAARYYL